MTKYSTVLLAVLSHLWIYSASLLHAQENREERVRYEILTLNALARVVNDIESRDMAAWPMAWHEMEQTFWQAARNVINVDSEILADCIVSDSISPCLSGLPDDAYKFMQENATKDLHFVILGVWRIIISYEPKMQRGSRRWFASRPASRLKGLNDKLPLAIEILRSIQFERSNHPLMEIRTFLALRTLRCLYLWNPQHREIKVEEFALKGLSEVLPSETYLKLIGNPKQSLNDLVLNDDWMVEATFELFKSP